MGQRQFCTSPTTTTTTAQSHLFSIYMLCSLSGEEAQEPVVSPKSGCIFERRLVELYISTTGKDPVSEDSLTVDELIAVKSKDPVIVPPKPAAFNSIPTMLQAFQNEWDALALETFTLRKELQNTRQELSASLYQYDAAVRVANRALKERDEAREALTELSQSFAQFSKDQEPEPVKTEEIEPNEQESVSLTSDRQNDRNDDRQNVQIDRQSEQASEKSLEVHNGREVNNSRTNGLPHFIAQDVLEASQKLFAQHKSLKLSTNYPFDGDIMEGKSPHNVPHPYRSMAVASNGRIAVYNKNTVCVFPERRVFRKRAPIMAVCFAGRGDQVFVACNNNQIYLHTMVGNTTRSIVHSGGDLYNLLVHPSIPMTIGINRDRWLVYYKNREAHNPGRISDKMYSEALHVDGRLLAIGTLTGKVMIYDIVTNGKVASIDSKYRTINKLQFAYNGYWLFVASFLNDGGMVQLFDLRKNVLVQEFNYGSRVEFAIDKSCLVLVASVMSDKMIYYSFYDKKTKKWIRNQKEVDIDDEGGILLIEYLPENTIRPKFVGLTRSHLVDLEMAHWLDE